MLNKVNGFILNRMEDRLRDKIREKMCEWTKINPEPICPELHVGKLMLIILNDPISLKKFKQLLPELSPYNNIDERLLTKCSPKVAQLIDAHKQMSEDIRQQQKVWGQSRQEEQIKFQQKARDLIDGVVLGQVAGDLMAAINNF